MFTHKCKDNKFIYQQPNKLLPTDNQETLN